MFHVYRKVIQLYYINHHIFFQNLFHYIYYKVLNIVPYAIL